MSWGIWAFAAALVAGTILFGVFLWHAVSITEENLLGLKQLHLEFSANTDLTSFRAEDENPSAPVVVFCHETGAAADSVSKYATFLATAGYRMRPVPFGIPKHSHSHRGLAILPVEEQVTLARAALIEAAAEAGEAGVILFGVSRGAGVAVLAAAAEPGLALRALVLDSFFSWPDLLASKVKKFAPIYLGRLAYWVPSGLYPTVARIAGRRVGRRVGVVFLETAPVIRGLKVPTLLLHGARDRAAPKAAVQQYHQERRGPSQLELFPKAKHNQSCLLLPERYQQVVSQFLEESGAGVGEGPPG